MADDKITAALLRQRAASSDPDQVRTIDKQLASLGYVPEDAPARTDEPKPAARGRRTAKG